MTENPVLHILRICLALIAAPWALGMTAFVLIACLTAQVLGLFASLGVFALTQRWASTGNVVCDVAMPRIADMWRDWSALWRSGRPKGQVGHA